MTTSTWQPLNIALITITVLLILYKYFTKNFDYWKKKNVPYIKPWPLVGNLLEVFTFRISIGQYLAKQYNTFNTPYFGMFMLNKPHLVIRSPELIKSILYKDFNYFPNRTLLADEKLDSFSSKLLFVAANPEWKFMRTKISPAFSLGKIKSMVGLVNEIGEDMKIYLDRNMHSDSIETKEVCAKYATEVIASCAFGIKANCFEDENAQFRVLGRKLFDFDSKTTIRQLSYFLAPSLVKLFRMPFIDPSVTGFIREFVWKSIENREKTKIVRNDVIDMMIKIRRQNSSTDEFEFDGDRVAAQCGQFYTAGFETISATMSFALYELSLQPKIQNKLRTEIKTALAQHGFTYEALQEMKYMNMVIYETLRKYPVLPFLDRMCDRDYKVPDDDLVIEKGTPIYIPMIGLQYDPQYFPEPERFDPERFSDQNRSSLPSFAYMPFGGGPRNCIGEQLGLMVSKLGLSHILSQFEVARSSDTPVPIEFIPSGFLLASTVGLPLKIKKLDTV